jgi:hypothetical protein
MQAVKKVEWSRIGQGSIADAGCRTAQITRPIICGALPLAAATVIGI